MRPGAGAYGAGGEDDEGVEEFKKQIFRKSNLIDGGLSSSEGRCWMLKTEWLVVLKICGEKELRENGGLSFCD